MATLVSGPSGHFGLSPAQAITDAADNGSVVIRQSLMQMDTPNAIRGRVAAVNSIFIGASNQPRQFESGATTEWVGPVASVLIGGAGTLLCGGSLVEVVPRAG